MATQSIMKNIVISEPQAAEAFICALETAAEIAETSVIHNIETEDLSAEDLKRYYGVIKK